MYGYGVMINEGKGSVNTQIEYLQGGKVIPDPQITMLILPRTSFCVSGCLKRIQKHSTFSVDCSAVGNQPPPPMHNFVFPFSVFAMEKELSNVKLVLTSL